MKKTLLCLLMCLLLALPAWAEAQVTDPPEPQYATPEEEIAALYARIDELEAIIANLEERLSRYESVFAVAIDPNTDVIVFNGGSVKLSAAQAAYDEIAALYQEFGVSESEYADSVKADVLSNLAEEAILIMKAEEMGLYTNTPEQQAEAEADALNTYEATLAYYIPYFEAEGLTEAEVRAEAEAYILAEGISYDYILADTLRSQWQSRLYDAVTADVTVTEDDIRALYDSGLASAKELYTDPAMFEYDYISGELIFTYPEGYREVEYLALSYNEEELAMEPDARVAAISDRYAELISRAASGEDMIELAEEYLLFDYGSLPVSENAVLMPESFNTAAMALAAGETSAPVDGESGVWIIRCIGELTPGDIPYETLRDMLTETAAISAKDEAYNLLVDQWLVEAEIITYPDLLQ